MRRPQVSNHGEVSSSRASTFVMIDNYIYMYHTQTLVILPTYPESITDSMAVGFQDTSILARSAPIYSYSGSGPRSLDISLHLHRDMMNDVNVASSKFYSRFKDPNDRSKNLLEEDYVDLLVRQLQAMALPKYAVSEKMVDPPVVALRLGDEIFCKGVVIGAVSVQYSGPILRTNKYAEATISFTLHEIDPYDADTVMTNGSFRGLNLDLERNLWIGA